jgi:hypothetical protein
VATVTFASSRSQLIDGVIYTISVYKLVSGFAGIWECLRCKDHHSIQPKPESEIAAFEECQRQIVQHHAKHEK